MPPLFSNGDNEYVYVWIAPYGYNDQVIESMLGQNKFLANRHTIMISTMAVSLIGMNNKIEWDASSIASGVYFYGLKTDKEVLQTRKLVLLK